MQIVELTELFIKDVFEWRNDKISRAMSFSSEKINFESHLYWFKNMMNDKNQFVYVGIEEEKRIGICRFNLDKKNHREVVFLCLYILLIKETNAS